MKKLIEFLRSTFCCYSPQSYIVEDDVEDNISNVSMFVLGAPGIANRNYCDYDMASVEDINDSRVQDALNYLRWSVRGAVSAALIRIYSDELEPPYDSHEEMKSLISHSVAALLAGVKLAGARK